MRIDLLLAWLILCYKASFFIGLLSLVAAKYALPDFLQYGKTLNVSAKEPNVNRPILYRIAHLTVPKSFFSHFYYLSSCLSILTLMRYSRVPIVWLLLFHSLRRLYETKYVCKYTTNSRMNWSHYAVGIWFYASLHLILNAKLEANEIPLSLCPLPTIVFMLASVDQFINHRTLSRLVKYSMPEEYLFKVLCCPHYFDEILIYATFISYNAEFWWPFLWVTLSLTISALENQNYYLQKFGNTHRIPKWAIIPLVI